MAKTLKSSQCEMATWSRLMTFPLDRIDSVLLVRTSLVISQNDSETADNVQLNVIDVRDNSQHVIGEYSPSSRGLIVDDDIFLVVTPDGNLNAIDIAAGRTKFSTTLQEMPNGFQQLRCLPWQDTYILSQSGRKTGRMKNASTESMR